MKGTLTLVYGLACYLAFFLVFLYAVGFVGDFLVPRTVDRGPVATWPVAVVIDALLLGLFALQHSGMARRGFKRWLTGWMSESIERSTYVLLSSLVLALLFWQWRPIPLQLWTVDAPAGQWLLFGLYALGWLIVLTGTFAINHFDLFGLRQVWYAARRQHPPPLKFTENFYYALIRHPLMLGFIIAFWATPDMSVGHLLFAAASTVYILIAVRLLEERDLIAMHGDAYRNYRTRVPMILPWPRPRVSGGGSAPGMDAPGTGAGMP